MGFTASIISKHQRVRFASIGLSDYGLNSIATNLAHDNTAFNHSQDPLGTFQFFLSRYHDILQERNDHSTDTVGKIDGGHKQVKWFRKIGPEDLSW